ncbi:MAG: hypothetical protein WBW57_09180 [Candidatus Sulfotelmatobacter sp.]
MAAQRPQLKRPEQAPSETPPEPKPKKLVNEPRAVGVLQLNNSGKGTLIPIAIRIDGKFYDASIYKADPVPMALDVGTVYEVEKTGQSEGLFTVGGALHNQNPNSATPWLGAGAYVLNGTVAANNIHKAEDKPRGLDDDNDAPPRLTRGNEAGTGNQNSGGGSGSSGGGAQKTSTAGTAGSGSAAPGAGPQSAGGASGEGSTAAGAGSTSNSTTSSSGSDESGPPQLKRTSRDDSGNCGQQSTTSQSTKAGGQGTNTPGSAGSSSASGASAQGGSAPSGSGSASNQAHGTQDQSSQSQSGQNQSSQNQSGQSQSGQSYYRPTLRRGKPTQSAPEDTPDELTRTTETEIPNAKAGVVTAPSKPAVQLVPAISDAGGPLPESFQFFWKEDEERDRKKQMLELAANAVRAYLATMAKDTIPAKPEATKGGAGKHSASAHSRAAKVEPEFENIDFRAFDVWRNNQPVMILTGEAILPRTKVSAAASSTSDPVRYYVTVAARTDIYGDLRKLYAGVTDKFHLDVTPKLELIDAVDADGDGRGELLFRETTDAGNGYIIFRPTGDTLWKMFDSLNQE